MPRNSTYNILMYSHDTYGLGHIRRTMAIASHLRGPDVNILILTGSPIVGRFAFPEQVDFVRIPGMIKKTNQEYLPMSFKIPPKHALDIRKKIITATAKAFQPDVFIVDKEPLGLKKEVLPTLQWLRRALPRTHTVLGLRDIMDDAPVVRQDWAEKGVYGILETLYSEIWVYGIQEFYDPIREYAIPASVSHKVHFTGYIPRDIPAANTVRQTRKEQGVCENEKLVLVTAGGGHDGYALMDAYLAMLESEKGSVPFKSVIITGPFMPVEQRRKIFERARRLGVRTYRFYRWMEKIESAADLVVGMGGYNTVCEVLSQKTVSLLIPRENPRKEQLIRARVFKQNNLVDYIPWHACTPRCMHQKIFDLLENPQPYREAISRFRLTGLETMQHQLHSIRNPGP